MVWIRLLSVVFFIHFLLASSTRVSRYSCKKATDVIVLIESKKEGFRNETFSIHKNTALDFINQLPMAKANIQVTLAQFSDGNSRIEFLGGISDSDTILDDKQRKFEALDKLFAIRPLAPREKSENAGGLIGAFELVANTVVPKLRKKKMKGAKLTTRKRSRIILVTIVSAFWPKPDLLKLADTFDRLRKRRVTSYIVAYDTKEAARRSILLSVVSKPSFLILPEHRQTAAAADQLTNVLQVCWKRGPCWPRNPCGYGCECEDEPTVAKGFKCRSLGSLWLSDDCTKPSALLTCNRDSVELRLPRHYITDDNKPPTHVMVISGMSSEWQTSGAQDCFAKVVDSSTEDFRMDQKASAMLESEGFYYLLVVPFVNKKCFLSIRPDVNNNTLTIEGVVFKSSSARPEGDRVSVPLMIMRCVYPIEYANIESFNPTSMATQSSSSRNLYDLQSDEGDLDISVLSQTILLEGRSFNYQQWRDQNPFRDPDEITEMIGRNGGMRGIVEGVKSGRILVVLNDPFATCHPGPYEEWDPCHPMYRPTTQEISPSTVQLTTGYFTSQATLTTLGAFTTQLVTTTQEALTTQSIKTTQKELTTQSMTTVPKESTARYGLSTEKLSTVQELQSTAKDWSTTQPLLTTQGLPDETKALLSTQIMLTTRKVASTTQQPKSLGMQIKIYEDRTLTREFDFGGTMIGRRMFVLVGPGKGNSLAPGTCSYVQTCYLVACARESLESNGFYITKTMAVVKNGCPMQKNAVDLQVLDNGRSPNALFSLLFVPFEGGDATLEYYVQCSVTLCDCSRGSCGNSCPNHRSLLRRSVNKEPRWELRAPLLLESRSLA